MDDRVIKLLEKIVERLECINEKLKIQEDMHKDIAWKESYTDRIQSNTKTLKVKLRNTDTIFSEE